jgi:acyl-[acyl carrier protein]--UDP-N-acetylglucosamine O-acyltransferase
MNNLIFNTTASDLKTTMYGYNGTTLTLEQLQLDAGGNMLVGGTVTVGNDVTIAGTVTVGNDVTIAGTVTVGNDVTVAGTVTIGNNVTIANTSLTVAGTVTVGNDVTIAGTVTVGNDVTIAGTVTVGNTSLTVLISGQTFTSATENVTATGTGIAFADTDISTLTTASMFIDNPNANPFTISLQLSPDGGTTYFDDPSYTDVVVAATSQEIIAIGKFAQFAQILYDTGASPATFTAYFNGQA